MHGRSPYQRAWARAKGDRQALRRREWIRVAGWTPFALALALVMVESVAEHSVLDLIPALGYVTGDVWLVYWGGTLLALGIVGAAVHGLTRK